MNPLRFISGEWTPALVGLLVLAVLILLVNGWFRRRERRGDWGPGLAGVTRTAGYSPADLRRADDAVEVQDAGERWLLGLAAPFVEQAALRHDRWSLAPAFCDDAWKRKLAAVAGGRGVVRAREWKRAVAHLERQIAEVSPQPRQADLRPWMVAELAMLWRLGVALRHTNGRIARQRVEQFALPLREQYSDWLGYGDAFLAAAEVAMPGQTIPLRADVRTLFAPGGPWVRPSWS